MDIQFPLGATVQIETLEQAIDLFVTNGMPARNLSPQTRKSYRHDLVDLLAFLNDRGASTLSDISLLHLEAYQAEMDRREYSASTRNRKTHSIKSLFHFLHRLGITTHNIAEKLIPPSVQKHEPRFLSEAEYQQLLREYSHKPCWPCTTVAVP
jgi:integrase/recombinase XerD